MPLRIATSDKFLLWFLRWRNVPLTIRQLARDIESYQASHPDFRAYEGMRLEEEQDFLDDLDQLHEQGAIEFSAVGGLDTRLVTLSAFGDLEAALFEPHWENATNFESSTA